MRSGDISRTTKPTCSIEFTIDLTELVHRLSASVISHLSDAHAKFATTISFIRKKSRLRAVLMGLAANALNLGCSNALHVVFAVQSRPHQLNRWTVIVCPHWDFQPNVTHLINKNPAAVTIAPASPPPAAHQNMGVKSLRRGTGNRETSPADSEGISLGSNAERAESWSTVGLSSCALAVPAVLPAGDSVSAVGGAAVFAIGHALGIGMASGVNSMTSSAGV
jgi:hypothetical protein